MTTGASRADFTCRQATGRCGGFRSLRHRGRRPFSRARLPARVARPRLCRRDALPRAHGRTTRGRARRCCRRRGRSSCWARSTTPTARTPTSGATTASTRRDRALRVGRRLSRRHPAAPRRAAGVDARVSRRWLRGRGYVDTGPVQERVYAQHAGLGWIGKNTCVINEELGSWMFLSVIISNAAARAGCAGVRSVRHLHALPRRLPDRRPGRAVRSRLDALHLVPDDRAEGHDIPAERADVDRQSCLRVRHLSGSLSVEPHAVEGRVGRRGVAAAAGARRAAARSIYGRGRTTSCRQALKGSAMKRAGVRRLRRNLAVAIGNSGDAAAAAALTGHQEPTCQDPLVTGHVDWAAARLRGQTS